MRYSLERGNGRNHTAGFKAVDDVTTILHELGYKPLIYANKSPNRIYRNVSTCFLIIRLLFVIKIDDVCLLQWPLLSNSDKLLYYVLKKRCHHLQLLIHDLTSIRFDTNAWVEKKYLHFSELIIVHTPAMKDAIISLGVEASKIKVLECFDYLVKDDIIPNRELSNKIVFAGNLAKSEFLTKICDYPQLGNMSFLCYGKQINGLEPPLIYMGLFEPESVTIIQGSWGLVWDGESVETCNGELGDYLKFNSPHKFSLYIVARLPLIVWKDSALAYYVIEKGLGVVISSLLEIPSVLSNIDREKYIQILFNLDKERDVLIKGGHLKRLFKQ